MDRSVSRGAATHPRKKKRNLTLLWIAIAAAVIILLLWQEQIAILYVLATLGVAVLLSIVAVADLSGARRAANQPPPFDDAAAISDGTSGTSGADTWGATSSSRGAKRRRK
ncbi:MAG TPA: hypothetical protein VM934_00910 [Pyrinomonadaceae bacterium]|jgi:hypothetical protein|nr:hypothetical protein [Pyrinomonadaceae bacterium]